MSHSPHRLARARCASMVNCDAVIAIGCFLFTFV